MKDKTNIQELWDLFVSDKATEQEVQALFEYIKSADQDDEHIAYFKEALDKVPRPVYKADDTAQSILDTIIASNEDLKISLDTADKAVSPVHRIHFLKKWGWAAASIILVLGMGAYLWTTHKKNAPSPAVAVTPADIAPGKNGAILTLANGSQVVLDSLGNGLIASQNGAKVILKNSGLAYDPSGQLNTEVTYNTMTTPKGRQFQVVLSDGTRVWLNAASSIRYPTAFAGKERKVDVTGEAYFEVAKNTKMPFRVNINGRAEVEVLGTHFNVNAYGNEDNISTTLLEGSVRVTQMQDDKKAPSVILKPGQQAQVLTGQQTQQGIKVVNEADKEKVMAWKNGLFNFDGLTLPEAMRQLERWYDIRIVFKGPASQPMFGGDLHRDANLSDILDVFKKMGLKYEWDGETLTIF